MGREIGGFKTGPEDTATGAGSLGAYPQPSIDQGKQSAWVARSSALGVCQPLYIHDSPSKVLY